MLEKLNLDGKISCVFVLFPLSLSRSSFSVLFRLYDSDGDGSVGREDVERVMEAMHKMVGPLLIQEKTDEDEGKVTSGERGTPDELSVAASTRVKEICKVLNQVSIQSLIYNIATLCENALLV